MSVAGTVVVFARAPERGRVKTRLARAIGDRATLALYRAFLADTLANARASGACVLLAHTPAPRFPEQALVERAFPQRGDTFAARFDAALADARAAAPAGPLVLVGADTPHLAPARYRAAFAALARSDAVVGLAPRGGFHLLGFRGAPEPVAPAFDAQEDGPAVAALLAARGLRVSIVAPSFDLDEAEDLARLAARRDLLEEAPATASALRYALRGASRVGSRANAATPASNATRGS